MENANTRNFIAKSVMIALLGAFALGACGIKGDLKTPPPLWGDKSKQAEQAEKKPAEDKQESNN